MYHDARSATHRLVRLTAPGRCESANAIGDRASISTTSPASTLRRTSSRATCGNAGITPEVCPTGQGRLLGVEATENLVDQLARLSLFADLADPQLQALAHMFSEEVFAEGQRVLRQDVSGTGFYVIMDGDAKVVIDGEERARLTRGDFFGEISILTGAEPTADVVATSVLRCLVIADTELKPFLLKQPSVMYRLLQVEAGRSRAANLWTR